MSDIEIIYDGPYIRLIREQGWEYIKRNNCGGIAVILPVTDDGKIVILDQYRLPLKRRVIELPAGLIDDLDHAKGESKEEAARRELLEETGFEADRMERLMVSPVSAGASADVLDIFLATGLKKVQEGGGDENEDIIVHEIELSHIDEWLAEKQKEGFLIDHKVQAALYVLLRRGNLSF